MRVQWNLKNCYIKFFVYVLFRVSLCEIMKYIQTQKLDWGERCFTCLMFYGGCFRHIIGNFVVYWRVWLQLRPEIKIGAFLFTSTLLIIARISSRYFHNAVVWLQCAFSYNFILFFRGWPTHVLNAHLTCHCAAKNSWNSTNPIYRTKIWKCSID